MNSITLPERHGDLAPSHKAQPKPKLFGLSVSIEKKEADPNGSLENPNSKVQQSVIRNALKSGKKKTGKKCQMRRRRNRNQKKKIPKKTVRTENEAIN